MVINQTLVGKLVRAKRGNRSLHDVADEMGTTAPLIQRVEAGKVGRADTLVMVAAWLGVTVESLCSKPLAYDPVTQVEVLLSNDPNLNDESVSLICSVVRTLHKHLSKGNHA